MTAVGQEISPAKKRRANEHPLTFMVMGKVGKVRTFRLSRRFLFFSLLFFAAYLPFSAYLVNRYFELSHLNKSRQDRIESLERDLSQSMSALSRTREHVVFLEDYIFQVENREERAVQPSRPQARKADGAAGSPPDAKVRDQEDAIVSVENLVMEKQGGTLEVRFRIVNRLPGDATAGGYVHLTAKGQDGDARLEWTFPQVARVQGLPENYRLGQMFLIRKFKPMQAKILLGTGPDAPAILEILVYDQSGAVVLRDEFKIP